MEVIQEIKRSELLADTIIKNAHAMTKELILKAEVEAEAKVKLAVEQQINENREQLELFEVQNVVKSEEVEKISLEECKMLKEKSEAKMDVAIKFVIERIVR